MLLSYALNPRTPRKISPDVAARHGQLAPSTLAAALLPFTRWSPFCRLRLKSPASKRVYRDIDLPLAPVLFRMEQAGVRIDTAVLDGLSKRFAHRNWSAWASASFRWPAAASTSTRPSNLAKSSSRIWDCRLQPFRGKGKAVSTAQDVLEQLAGGTKSRAWCFEFRHLSKLKSNYIDALATAGRFPIRASTHVSGRGHGHGRLSSVNPNLQKEHSHPHRTGRRFAPHSPPLQGTQLPFRDFRRSSYVCLPLQRRSAAVKAYAELSILRHDGERSLRCTHREHGQGDAPSRQGRKLRIVYASHRLGCRAIRHFASRRRAPTSTAISRATRAFAHSLRNS